MVFSNDAGRLRHVEKTQVVEAEFPAKKGMGDSLTIETT